VSTREADILTRVETLLKTINGAGGFNYDLSGDHAVRWGDLNPLPGLQAQVCIWGANEASVNGNTWGAVASDFAITLSGYVRSGPDTPRQRVLNACNLLADLRKLFFSNKRLGSGLSRDVLFGIQAFDGQLLYPGYGAIFGTITVAHEERFA